MVSPYTSKEKNYDSVECELNKNPCRIVPGRNPLAKHKFYFDLKNRLAANKLETQIKELGGTVELFLVKEVTHLITDSETWYKNKNTAPKTPQSELGDALPNGTPNSKKTVRPKTRADAMLERARCTPTNVVSNPLDDARKWGVSIWPVEKAFAWLDRVAIQVLAQKKKVKVFELREPYIKFEAFDRKTRPVFKEIRDWPVLNLEGAPGEPAFVCRSRTERNMTRKTRVTNQRNDTLQPGYCEVCRIEYSQLAKHLQSDKHQKFVNDNANFITLDTLIDDGANIESFLKLHGSEIKEKMCDSDSEYCPPLTRKKMPMNRANSVCEREKPKSLPLSPTGSETGGHRLRSRAHVNYVINTPTDEEYPLKSEGGKDVRELRSSTRLLKVNDHITENDKTWESGRPKRSCIMKKRISTDERVLLEKRAYYKVEVMLNKLRSSAREHEIIKRPETPIPEGHMVDEKGLIVKFRRIRNSELTFLNNEAENFLFPRKDDTSDEDPDADGPNTTASSGKHDSTLLLSSEADENMRTRHRKSEDENSETCTGRRRHKKVDYRTGKVKIEDERAMDGFSENTRRRQSVNCRRKIKVEEENSEDGRCSPMRRRNNRVGKFKVEDDGSMDSNCSEGSASRKKRRRTHAEAFIMDNQKYYKFETPGSRLRYQGSFLSPPVGMKSSSPPKNNGDCASREIKDKELGHLDDVKIKLSDLQFSFERVPKEEPWFEAFRRQDTGEVQYMSLTDPELTRQFLLPYQLGPLPPLDPQICVSAYKLKRKLMESSSASTSTSTTSDSTAANVDPAVNDEDSKASGTTDTTSIDIQSELLKIIEEQKPSRRKVRRRPMPGRNPRKSPRQHASTLAILSSLVHHRKKRDLNRSRGSDLSTSRHSLPAIPEEGKEDVPDYNAIESDLEKMLTRMEGDLDEVEVSLDSDSVSIQCKPDAIEALETYEEVKVTFAYPRIVKRVLRSPGRKPGRKKKKKNRTGWPNRNRRINIRKEAKDDDARSVDSAETQNGHDTTDNCAELVVASVGDKLDGVNVDLDKWESAEKEFSAKLTNGGDVNVTGAEFQPYVRVQKLETDVVVRHGRRRLRSSSSPLRADVKRPRRKPPSPRSPRMLRKPRGRWYRER